MSTTQVQLCICLRKKEVHLRHLLANEHSRIKSLLLLRVFVCPKVKKEVQIRYQNIIKQIKVISAACTDDAATDKSWSHSSHILLFGHAALQRRPVSSSVKVKKKPKTTSWKQLRLAGVRTVSKVSNQCDKHRNAAGEVRTYLRSI